MGNLVEFVDKSVERVRSKIGSACNAETLKTKSSNISKYIWPSALQGPQSRSSTSSKSLPTQLCLSGLLLKPLTLMNVYQRTKNYKQTRIWHSGSEESYFVFCSWKIFYEY